MTLTTVNPALLDTQAQYTGFKNRIINGAMVIDQRNAGASVTITGVNYSVDRFFGYASVTSKFTLQQNAGAVTPPAGFKNYLGAVSSAITSLGAGDFYLITHRIEGYNIADLAWGTASAAAVTLSFKVYSSLTGTFGGTLANGAGNRSYPFTYSIPVANTWTIISITITGDTTGTWATDNSNGISINFGLGVGTTYSGTANAWSGTTYFSATGAVSVVGTNAATWYVTGVQLEKGSTATSFDYRDYGRELIMCQRYYTFLGGVSYAGIASGMLPNTTNAIFTIMYPVAMRSAPSISYSNLIATDRTAFDTSVSSLNAVEASLNGAYLKFILSSASPGSAVLLAVTNGTTGRLTLSSEL